MTINEDKDKERLEIAITELNKFYRKLTLEIGTPRDRDLRDNLATNILRKAVTLATDPPRNDKSVFELTKEENRKINNSIDYITMDAFDHVSRLLEKARLRD